MSCCGNRNIIDFSGKCSDMFMIEADDGTFDTRNGVPENANIGGGDYVTFSFCANCGQMLGKFPIEFEEKKGDEYE